MDGTTRDTGGLGFMMGPKFAPADDVVAGVVADDELGVEGPAERGFGVPVGVEGADCAASGCGGGVAPVKDFATRTPPTSRSTTVTAAAMVLRRSPNRER
jgi:hypothetical protein